MSMQLQHRVTALETTVKSQADDIEALQKTVRELIDVISAKPLPANASTLKPRQMCPKCNEQPNYFLHFKYCKGKQKVTA